MLFKDEFELIRSKAEKLAEAKKVKDMKYKQLIFKYNGSHLIIHNYKGKWIISLPYHDKYWFDFIEDRIFEDLTELIDSL